MAVIGRMAGWTTRNPSTRPLAAVAALMTNMTVALRGLSLVVMLVPELAVEVGIPLGFVALAGVDYALHFREWNIDLDVTFESPLSLGSAP